MPRRILAVLLAAAAAAETGCVSVFPKSTPAQLYRFGDDEASPGETRVEAPAPADARLRVVVEGVVFPHASTADGILTVEGDKTAYIAGARWVSPARILFQEALERRVQRSPTLLLGSLGDPGPPALLLRVMVSTFEVSMTPSRPDVHIALQASLAQPLGGDIQVKDLTASAAAGSSTQRAIVAAYDRAVDDILTKLVAWGGKAAAQMPPPAPPTATVRVTRRTLSTSDRDGPAAER